MFTVIAALRAGGVGSCWDLSTNSMSNRHLIPPHVCLLPHWVIEKLNHLIGFSSAKHLTHFFVRKPVSRLVFLICFLAAPFPFTLFWLQSLQLGHDELWVWFSSTGIPTDSLIPSPCLVRTVLSQGLVLSDNVLIYWTVCSWGFITVFQLPLSSGLISGKHSLWTLGSTVFT